MHPIKFILLSDDMKAPTKHLTLGYDIYIPKPDVIHPHEQENIETNLQLKIPRGYYIKIILSDQLMNKMLTLNNDIIDSNVNGNVMLKIINHGNTSYFMYPNNKLARLIMVKKIVMEMIRMPQEICINWNYNRCHDICPYLRSHVCKICKDDHPLDDHHLYLRN